MMAANVLNSPHAVRMSVFVVRAFIRLRHTVAFHKEIMIKLDELEQNSPRMIPISRDCLQRSGS